MLNDLKAREANRQSHVCPTQHMALSHTPEDLEKQAQAGLDWKGRRYTMVYGERRRDLQRARKRQIA